MYYKYEKKKYNIITKTIGYGGNIEGDEIVSYGASSTKEKIRISSISGYVIDKITINGEGIDVKDNTSTMVVEYFKSVTEDKLIEVTFKQAPVIVPNTLSGLSILTMVLGGVLVIIGSYILLFKKKVLSLIK